MLIDEGTTVGVWAQKWLDVYCKNAMGEGCYQNYAGIVKNQIAPRIGALKLKDVRPIHCQSVLNAEIGRSSSFLSKIRQVMFRMFKYAKREGVIATNPADDLCPYCLRHPYVKHTTKIFSLRLMDFQAQAYPDARRKTRGACQLHRGGQNRSSVRPLCNRKRFS